MKYYEGIDYTVHKVCFPNCASEALILSNPDGTYTILLNARFPDGVLRSRLRHELAHLRGLHLISDEKSLWEKELEADCAMRGGTY